MIALNEIGYNNTVYKLRSQIELNTEPQEEYGVILTNKEYDISEYGNTEKVALLNTKRILAIRYEDAHHITDDKYSPSGLKGFARKVLKMPYIKCRVWTKNARCRI